MQRFVASFLGVIVFGLIPSTASAQAKGKMGVTMGFPASAGLLWHVTEDVAVRPEVSFGWNSSEAGASEAEGSNFTTGASVLFYLRKCDNMAAYASPRYAFGRSTSTSISSFGGESERTSHSHLFSGSFGAQYWLGERFSVFGELGLVYQRSTADANLDVPPDLPFEVFTESRSRSFASRSAAGVVFYF